MRVQLQLLTVRADTCSIAAACKALIRRGIWTSLRDNAPQLARRINFSPLIHFKIANRTVSRTEVILYKAESLINAATR